MKAVILVGGYGTRLRPLTLSYPKSVFPFLNKPMVQHQIQALVKVGVTEIILCINYRGQLIMKDLAHIQDKYKEYNLKLTCSQETFPLGTAGPLKLIQGRLKQNNPSNTFICLNSDIICDYPFAELIQSHQQNKAQATIVLATVADPSRFGVVVYDQNMRVQSFVEKPKHFISNKINAGMYILNVSVLDKIPLNEFSMLEKTVFPTLASQHSLCCILLKNEFWFDIGKPFDYLKGQGMYLTYYNTLSNIHQGTVIPNDCIIGENVVIGPECKLGNHCSLDNCTLVGNVKVGNHAVISNSIISWNCKVGDQSSVTQTIMAEDVTIKEKIKLSETSILPQVTVNQDKTKEIVMF